MAFVRAMTVKVVLISATTQVCCSPHWIVTCIGAKTHVASKTARDMTKSKVATRQEGFGGLQSGIVKTSPVADKGVHVSPNGNLVDLGYIVSWGLTLHSGGLFIHSGLIDAEIRLAGTSS